jgi:hypothetical protein
LEVKECTQQQTETWEALGKVSGVTLRVKKVLRVLISSYYSLVSEEEAWVVGQWGLGLSS